MGKNKKGGDKKQDAAPAAAAPAAATAAALAPAAAPAAAAAAPAPAASPAKADKPKADKKGGDKGKDKGSDKKSAPTPAASAAPVAVAATATATATAAAAAPADGDSKQKQKQPKAAKAAKGKPAADDATATAAAGTAPAEATATAAAPAPAHATTKPAKAEAKANAVLMCDLANPPLAALAAIELAAPSAHAQIKTVGKNNSNTLTLTQTRDNLTGAAVVRYIARLSDATGETRLYGGDALAQTHVDSFLETAATATAAGADGVAKLVKAVDALLRTRTFLVSHHLTVADLAVWECIKKSGGLKDASATPNAARWYSYLEAQPALKKSGEGVAKATAKVAEMKDHGASGSFNIPLAGAEIGRMCTRFPPEPSGYLHIGHAKAALLNRYFASEWKGTLILRFDDTNPGKEKQEYVDNILADLVTLGIKHDKLSHSSDYFDQCQKYAEQLIEQGDAYCDNTPVDVMRKERGEGIDNKCRGNDTKENLRCFHEMLKGSDEGKAYVLRAKIGMTLNNKCMRDPTLYRCNAIPHHRTKDKYKAYPTYDFVCPIIDSLEGVTHCLRTSEYHDRNEQYNWMLKALKLKHLPYIWDYSRLSFVYTVLSKRKLQWFVDQGLVEGWNDPRFPTVQGMIRRGLTVPALREFILSQGASKAITTQEWDKIWTLNKYLLDPIAPRYTAVDRDSKVEFRLSGGGAPTAYTGVSVQLVPKDKSKGNKVILQGPVIYIEQEDAKLIADNEEVTLINWGNAIATKVVRDAASGRVLHMEGSLHLAGNVKTTSKKLTWIAKTDADLVPCVLTEFDHLLTERLLVKGMDHKAYVNKVTKFETPALGEPSMRLLQKGDIIQLQRRGFYRVDSPYVSAQRPMVLFFVPDGKSKSMSLLGNKTSVKK